MSIGVRGQPYVLVLISYLVWDMLGLFVVHCLLCIIVWFPNFQEFCSCLPYYHRNNLMRDLYIGVWTYMNSEVLTSVLMLCDRHFTHWAISLAQPQCLSPKVSWTNWRLLNLDLYLNFKDCPLLFLSAVADFSCLHSERLKNTFQSMHVRRRTAKKRGQPRLSVQGSSFIILSLVCLCPVSSWHREKPGHPDTAHEQVQGGNAGKRE